MILNRVKKPFYYGGVVSQDHFCNRVQEIKELKNDMDTGLNVLLYAPRRFGKTSLVLKAVKQTNYKYIFLDFMSIVDEEEFINEYFNAISKALYTTSDNLIHFMKKILGIRPNINVEFDINGMPTFSLNFNRRDTKSVLKEVLEIPYQYAKHSDEKIVIIFDEFQEVINLNIEDKLRAAIQHHGDSISYIFSGSKKSIMTKLFFDKSKSFYKSVKHLSIDKINESEWHKYITQGFNKFDKFIEKDHIHKILDISKGFPYYTQQIANELFSLTNSKVDDDLVEYSIKSIIKKEEDLFLNEWHNLSQYQKKALKLLIYANGEAIYTKDTMERFNFTSSSLKKAVEGLLNKDIIDLKTNIYYMQDPLMYKYIKEMSTTLSITPVYRDKGLG